MLIASVLVLALCFLPNTEGSAIPMWEYLSRGEKMSHLFNLFVHQVEKHCASRPEPDCSKLLLVYGLTNLAKMEDESLDDMDPYQRGANEIVWDSMMKGSSKHNRVDVFNSGGLSPGKNSIPRPGSSTPNSVDASVSTEDLEVSEPGSLGAASDINVEEAEPQSFLLGPMVVRVLPNGMPIPGEKNQLPKDEDIEELAPSRYHRFPTGSRPSPNGRLIQSSSSPRIGYEQYRYGKQGPARFYPQQPSSYDTYRMRPREYPATR